MWLRFGQWMFVLIMLPPLLTLTAFSLFASLFTGKTGPEKVGRVEDTPFSAKGEAK